MLQCWSYDERRRPTFTEILTSLEQFIHNPKLLQSPVEMLDLSAPLLSPESPTSLQDVNNLDEWLDMVRLGRYRRSFYAHGIKDLESLAHITPRYVDKSKFKQISLSAFFFNCACYKGSSHYQSE